jgi:F-type H+-transporting ATPase subunit delta
LTGAAAQRYASALADIAVEQGAMEPVRKQLTGFRELTRQSPELRNFLANPAIAREAKRGAIEKIVSRMGASKILRNFLFVLVDHDRTLLLPEILAAFHDIILERQGIAEAQVKTAAELSASQKKDLGAALERLTGKKIEAQYELDPGLVGGAVVRIGSTIYDGSVRGQLERLRARLATQ